jgi:CRP/FNR family transcriptional regulator
MEESILNHFKKFIITHSGFLTDEDCALFEPYLSIKKLKAKDNLLVEGEKCTKMAFISKGAFRMFYLKDGKEINTNFFFENEFVFDYDSFLQDKNSKFNIQSLEDSILVTFSQKLLQENYQNSKNWERFGRIMAESCYKKMSARMESLLFLNGEQRYKELIENEPYILNRVPLYHIASYIGLERESLSRLRKKYTKS